MQHTWAMQAIKGMLAHKQLRMEHKKQARDNLCTTQPLTKLVAILWNIILKCMNIVIEHLNKTHNPNTNPIKKSTQCDVMSTSTKRTKPRPRCNTHEQCKQSRACTQNGVWQMKKKTKCNQSRACHEQNIGVWQMKTNLACTRNYAIANKQLRVEKKNAHKHLLSIHTIRTK